MGGGRRQQPLIVKRELDKEGRKAQCIFGGKRLSIWQDLENWTSLTANILEGYIVWQHF